ncbi:MAG: outer membrane beta-barrel protein [Candidatus Eisenbacteria bacterium]
MRARALRTLIVLCALTTLASARASEAQNLSRLRHRAFATPGSGAHFELTAFNGIQLPKDLYTSGGAKIGPGDGYTWGGRVAYHTGPKLGIELSYTRARSALELRKSSTGFPDSTALGGLVVHEFDIGVLLAQEAQPNAKTAGYLLFGVGATRFVGDIAPASGDVTRQRFAWHVGLGSKIRMGSQLSLRLEGRYRSTNTDPRGTLYTDAGGNVYTFAPHWYRTGELTAGLTYRIGG